MALAKDVKGGGHAGQDLSLWSPEPIKASASRLRRTL